MAGGPYQGHGFAGGNRAPARGPVGRGGAAAGHASTPASGAGGGSTSVVRACVRLRLGSAAGKLEVSEGNLPGFPVGKIQAPGLGVPGLRRPMPVVAATARAGGAGAGSLSVSGSSPVDFPLELASCGGFEGHLFQPSPSGLGVGGRRLQGPR